MTFGEKLQKLRKEAGLSQEELACQLGVSRQATLLWLGMAIVGVLLIFSAVLADNPYRHFSIYPLTLDKNVRAEL